MYCIGIIPVSATVGDNINQKSQNISWYTGKPLLKYLEDIETSNNSLKKVFT